MYLTVLDVLVPTVARCARQQGWKLPRAEGRYGESGKLLAHLTVPISQVLPHCLIGEVPARALKRIFDEYVKAAKLIV